MSFEVNIPYQKNQVTNPPPLATPRHVGRKKRWSEDMQARFPEGTFEQIASVLKTNEDRTDFVREAVEREIKRRQKARKR
jgi:hypothetical protein